MDGSDVFKKDIQLLEDTNNWTSFIHKNVSHLSSIMKMIDNSQSELLQAQIDLQDGQHQIRKLESILQIYNPETDKTQTKSYLFNTNQTNKNNDQESSKITELQNEIILVQKDNRNVKKHLESVFLSNSQLQNGIELIKNEMKKKDHIIQLSNQENKKNDLEKKNLESTITKLNSELHYVKLKYNERINTLKNKLRSVEINELKLENSNEELSKKLKENDLKIKDLENQIYVINEKHKLTEVQIAKTKQNFYNEMQNYEMKVKEIIEEMKIQKEYLEEESNKLAKELKISKKVALEITDSYKQVSQKLEIKDQDIQHLKNKLLEKSQFEEREKLLKRELDDNLAQIRNYKAQIIDLNSEKEKYLNRNFEQDAAIRHLLDEIKSLHNQLKAIKQQATDQNVWNESFCSSSNIARPNLSTPLSQSTSECINGQSQSLTNFVININNRSVENNGDNDNYKVDENDIMNNSECESADENTIQKLAHFLKKDQSEFTKHYTNSYSFEGNFQKKDNNISVADDFTRYLEEQLQLIKIAGERNLASIKRELTIK